MRSLIRLFAALALASAYAFAAQTATPPPTEKHVYKEVGDTKLEIWVWKPANWQPTDRRNAIVFYHGGGWRGGSPNAFSRQSEKLAARGMVAFSVQYRLTSQAGVTIEDCVKDARSAFRWVRANAAKFGIDADKIAAGGGSAGGHLAAGLANFDSVNDSKDDANISTRPIALVLFNPALKLGGMRAEPIAAVRDGVVLARVDPFEHIKRDHPPTIILHGEADTTVPIASVRAYAAKVESLGGRCQVVGFPDQVHAFFNKEPFVWETLKQGENFLETQGLLQRTSGTMAATSSSTGEANSERLASAKLLGVRRIQGRKNADQAAAPPDGLSFAVLISPTTTATEERSIKETRDFRVGGESYQEKTRAVLGKNFEPQTVVHDADKFLAATPALAEGTPPPAGSFVLTMTFGGAELPPGAPVELTLNVGYKKKPDTFVLRTKVPPSR